MRRMSRKYVRTRVLRRTENKLQTLLFRKPHSFNVVKNYAQAREISLMFSDLFLRQSQKGCEILMTLVFFLFHPQCGETTQCTRYNKP